MVVLQRISKFLSRIRQSAAVPWLFAVVLLAITMPGGSAPANPHGLSLDMASGAARPHGEKTPTLEYEISEGHVTLIIRGVDRTDVEDIFWDDESVLGTLGDIFDPGHKYNIVKDIRDGFTLDLGRHLSLEGPGVVEVKLTNGETLHKALLTTPMPTLEWLSAPQAASCTTAAGIYNAVRCDSVTSDVGTPPYPCCDNNGDGKATGATDGNCTWFAWYKAKKVKGWTVPSTWGGAGNWCAKAAKTAGWKVNSIPAVNTIACSSSIGHVLWVTGVSRDKKTITGEEMNCKVSPSCVGTGLRIKSYRASTFLYISKW